ncbi:MAG: hypothetical protein MJ252_06295 [archaeon]|nr:hypothetical protein [archaeon]
MIDRVEGEGTGDPNNAELLKEKEMTKYKRYIVSNRLRDLNIHKRDIISGFYHPKLNQTVVLEYDNKILKFYNLKDAHVDKTEDIRIAVDYYKDGEYRRLKEKGIKDIDPHKDLYQKKDFTVLSMHLNKKGIIGMCLSSSEIAFYMLRPNKNSLCLHVMETNILQKRIWYLPDHDIWLSSGRPEPTKEDSKKDEYYCAYELDVDFQKNYSTNKIECLHNGKANWFRQKYIERRVLKERDKDNRDAKFFVEEWNQMLHQGEIMDIIEIKKPRLILTACMDGKIRLIDINDNNFLKVWINPDDDPKKEKLLYGRFQRKGITSLCYSPYIDSHGLILMTGFHYHISIFATDMSLDAPYKGRLEGHFAIVVSITFLADSNMAASIDEEMVVKIWDLKSRQCLQSINPEKKNLTAIKIFHIPKYNRLASYGNKLIFYEPKYSEEEIRRQKINMMRVQNFPIQTIFNKYHMAFFLITSKDLRIYSGQNGQLIYTFKKFLEQERFDQDVLIKTFCFDYRHRLVYIGFSNGTVQQFNAGNGSLIKSINEYEVERDGITTTKTHHTKDVTSMFLFCNKPESPDAIFIFATTGLDSMVNIYDERDPEESTKLRGIKNSHKRDDKVSEILCMDFSHAFNKMATGSADGMICVWDFEKSKMEDINYYPGYCSGNYNVIALKFLDPFLVLAAAFSTGEIFLFGVSDPLHYAGKCFFRFTNYYKKDTGVFDPCIVRTMLFIYNNIDEVPNKVQYDKDLETLCTLSNIDDDLQNNEEYKPKEKNKAYLIMGDSKGYLRFIDLYPILNKFQIPITPKYKIVSTFNILKKEEINAEPSVIYLLQTEKVLTVEPTCLYPNLVHFEDQIHYGQIVYLSLIEEPYSFISSSQDKRARVWDFKMNLIAEIYTGAGDPDPPLAEWKFKIDMDKLKREEIEELLDIARSLDVDDNFYLPKEREREFKDKQAKKEREEEKQRQIEQEKKKGIFKTEVIVNTKRFKKKENIQKPRYYTSQDEDLNESYEQKVLNENTKIIDDMLVAKGQSIGMNELKNNVIDQIIEGKEVMNLFEPLRKNTIRKSVREGSRKLTAMSLPKIDNYRIKMLSEENERDQLYSEKFIKKADGNLKQKLLLPFLSYEFKKNENVRFRPGETEKILSFEYYNNAYKQCCSIKTDSGSIGLKENYDNMWKFVNNYASPTKKNGGKLSKINKLKPLKEAKEEKEDEKE